ncbi:MAG: alpha/beta fold hydrolase [Pseudomonadota bacterium]
MSARCVEEVLTAGRGARVFSILTLPEPSTTIRAVFVFLNAGLVHRVGPSRMNVRLARKLAAAGFASVRVDLSGKGDTPARPDVDYLDSVTEDFADLHAAIRNRLGNLPLVLAGLCSGADNAVRLALANETVVGMLLLDPMCYPDADYRRWSLIDRYLRWQQYSGKLRMFLSRQRSKSAESEAGGTTGQDDPLKLRVLPSIEDTANAVQAVDGRNGATLAIFSNYASSYYKHRGQFAATTYQAAFSTRSQELWWRGVKHTYKSLTHVERLENTVLSWASALAEPSRGDTAAP